MVAVGNAPVPVGAPEKPVVGMPVPGAIWMLGVTPPGDPLNRVVVLVTGMTGATGAGVVFWIVADADPSEPAAPVPTGAGLVAAGAGAGFATLAGCAVVQLCWAPPVEGVPPPETPPPPALTAGVAPCVGWAAALLGPPAGFDHVVEWSRALATSCAGMFPATWSVMLCMTFWCRGLPPGGVPVTASVVDDGGGVWPMSLYSEPLSPIRPEPSVGTVAGAVVVGPKVDPDC